MSGPELTRETNIRRTANGVWTHDGALVEHPGVRRAFDHWIDRDDEGRYLLRNSANWAFVEIEGAPVFALRARVEAERVMLELSDGRVEPLAPESLRRDAEDFVYCSVRDGRLTAKFTRDALMDIADAIEVQGDMYRLRVGDDSVDIPRVPDPIR